VFLFFKILPFLLHALHKIFKPFFSAEVFKEWLNVIYIWVIDKTAIHSIFQPFKSLISITYFGGKGGK
jgi:hypothetical protein